MRGALTRSAGSAKPECGCAIVKLYRLDDGEGCGKGSEGRGEERCGRRDEILACREQSDERPDEIVGRGE